MEKPLSIRPTKEIEKKLEKLIEIEKIEKSALIRKILNKGIDQELKKCALDLFRDKKVSLAKAAEIAGISVREMMEIIRKEGVSLHITAEDIQADYEAAME
jgi:predicted HTH domain antitoxin